MKTRRTGLNFSAFGAIAAALVLATLLGCKPANRMEQKVNAGSSIAFEMWRLDLADNFTPQERTEFNDLLQEIRFEIMSSREASGAVAVETAMRAKIDGRSLTQAADLGFETKLSRLERDRSSLEELMQQTARVHAREGDNASADYVAHRREEHSAQLERTRATIAETESAYVRWLGHPHRPHQLPDASIEQKRSQRGAGQKL